MNPDTPDATHPASRTHAQTLTRAKLDAYFRGAAFVVLLLIGAIATLRGYLALEHAIMVWLRPQWVPIAQTVFSLSVAAVCVWLIRAWVIARSHD